MHKTPKEVVQAWVSAFNRADVNELVSLYHKDAVNHQVAYEPLKGAEKIRKLFELDFGRARMVCQVENLFQDGEWAILEWSDPLGVRGCGFFQVKNGQIVFQRGYFDKLSFFRAQGIPLEEALK
jgi:limonene-1,2-epoxide hydrolase